MEFISQELDDYACKHTSTENELLQKINRETHLEVLQPRMLSGHFQGRLLSMFSKMINPTNILEIGTYFNVLPHPYTKTKMIKFLPRYIIINKIRI